MPHDPDSESTLPVSTFVSWCRIESRNADRRFKYRMKKHGFDWKAEQHANRRNALLYAAEIVEAYAKGTHRNG